MKIKLNSDLDQFWVNKIVFLIPSLCLIIPIQPQKNNFNMVEQYFRHCQYLWRDKFCIERNQFWKRRCFWHKLHYLFKNMWQKVNDPISCFKGHCAMLFPHTKFMMHLTVEALRPTTSDLPRAWVFQQLPGEVLMAILSQKHLFYCSIFGKPPLTCGNKCSWEGCLHMVTMTTCESNNWG